MKTSTSEVRCDHCKDVIQVMRPDGSGSNTAPVQLTLRGAKIGIRKYDFCTMDCLLHWTPELRRIAHPEQYDPSTTEV